MGEGLGKNKQGIINPVMAVHKKALTAGAKSKPAPAPTEPPPVSPIVTGPNHPGLANMQMKSLYGRSFETDREATEKEIR